METYEEKYKDLVKRLNKAREEKGVYTFNSVLDAVAPELKIDESKDEMIRKELISFFTERAKHTEDSTFNGLSSKEIIACLEKQDYTFEIKRGHWYKCVCDYMLNSSDLMFKNGRLYYCRSDWRLGGEIDERNVKDIGVNGYKSFFRPATNQEIKDWLEKQGEQRSKLIDFDLNANDSDLQEATYFIPDGYHAEIIGDKVVIKKGEQKSAEWSEEDKDMLGMLLEMINYASDHYQHDDKAIDIKAWVLKSLKDRVQPQPQKPWSEEDEYHKRQILRILKDNGCSQILQEKTEEWIEERLKFLRPQNSWKPNKEQMAALNNAILLNEDHYNGAVLSTLREQLKKLREE